MPTATFTGNVTHILLIGLDSTENLRGQNTDVIMVAVVNRDTKQASLLSIPRDLWVYIPSEGWNRINMAHKIGYRTEYPGGGPGLLGDTLLMNFGIPIDHWVRIDYRGFSRVIDELGGVEMTVACPVNLTFVATDPEKEDLIIEPGVHHLDGTVALRYVRTRRDGTDYDRARRQQQFIKSVWDQFKSPSLIVKLPGLWQALRDSYQTDMTLGDVLALAPTAIELEPHRVRSRYIGPSQVTNWVNADGWKVLLPRHDKIQELIASLYAPIWWKAEQAATEKARIAVQNGTYRHQLAKIGADQLHWYGLNIVETGLADRPNYQKTQVIVFAEEPQALDLLLQLLDVKPEDVIYQPDPSQSVDIRVILGNDYDPCH